MTPEGRVKHAVNKLLGRYDQVYRFMPVPGGYGAPTVDYLICAWGHFIGIETKAPGKKPTGRQEVTIKNIEQAGGKCFVIDDVAGTGPLEAYLNDIRDHQREI